LHSYILVSVLWFYQILIWRILYCKFNFPSFICCQFYGSTKYWSQFIINIVLPFSSFIHIHYIFQNACIVLDEHQVVMHSSDAIAPVGILHPLAFHLENKADVQYLKSQDNIHEICTQKLGSVYEVHDSLEGCEATYKPVDDRADAMDGIEHKFNISRANNKGTFSLSFWLQDSCNGHNCSLLFLFCFTSFTIFCTLVKLCLISLVQVCRKT